ncbi:MAG: hypothetical protein ACSLFD_07670 [Solirubrobacterales bacterium]
MSPVLRIGSFAALLAVVFAAAAVAGSRISPEVEESGPHSSSNGEETMSTHAETEADTTAHANHETSPASGGLPGLAVARDGYRLVADQQTFDAGQPQTLTFRIERDDGSTVEDFDVEHDRRMHLIVIRRDLQGFQHLHPGQRADGSWSVKTEELEPGVHRVFADFSTSGQSLTLGTEVFVPGQFEPEPLAPVSETADAGDGYEVTIDSAAAAGGETVPVAFEVTREGRPVDGVEPYLGADGHLVALREGDLAFLHTHPEGEPGGPGPIRFEVNYPSPGNYRLFLQFKHGGKVHTAAFTRVVGTTGHEHEGGASHD